MRKFFTSLITAAVLLGPATAQAATVTYNLEQRFNGTSNLYGPGPSSSGALLSGQISFDTSTKSIVSFRITTPGIGGSPTVYDSADPLTAVTTRFFGGGAPTDIEFFGVSITTRFGPIVTGTLPAAPDSPYGTSSQRYLATLGLTFLDTFTGADDLRFNQGEQVLEFGQTYYFQFGDIVPATGYGATVYNRATTTGPGNPGNASLAIAAVPLPAAGWLLGFGVVGLIALRRRKTA